MLCGESERERKKEENMNELEGEKKRKMGCYIEKQRGGGGNEVVGLGNNRLKLWPLCNACI